MSPDTSEALQSSVRRLFPNQSLEQVLVDLLLERAQKNLIKYQVMARGFAEKYSQDFDAFRREIVASEPTFELEQDTYDWELAVTGIADMEHEIVRLRELQHDL